MRNISLIIFSLIVFSLSPSMSQENSKREGLKISSSSFENNGQIPRKYTCDGMNVNPPIKIENVPHEAKSLALVFDDLDAPRGTFVHWILWDIQPSVKEIKENSIPEGAVQGSNDFKKQSYGGPCPPSRAHRYIFKVYALDFHVHLDPHSTKSDLENAIKGHVIFQGQLTGVYKRK